LNCVHGKTECWLILDSPADGVVYLGFAEDTTLDSLTAWMKDSDPAPMLAAMNRLPVQVGDAVLVPAGYPMRLGPASCWSSCRNRPTPRSCWNGRASPSTIRMTGISD